jgi:hypothetical protein
MKSRAGKSQQRNFTPVSPKNREKPFLIYRRTSTAFGATSACNFRSALFPPSPRLTAVVRMKSPQEADESSSSRITRLILAAMRKRRNEAARHPALREIKSAILRDC